jgi:hypothetical protein
MSAKTLDRLDSDIQHLTLSEQLWLLERLAHYIREQTLRNQLAEMAADPEIQREIGLIQAEFAVTEEDGLTDEA